MVSKNVPWYENMFNNYFHNQINIPSLSLSETRETVRHMNEVVTQKYLHYYTILAAILGGIIGCVFAKLL